MKYFVYALSLALALLKLTNNIHMSWLQVLSPVICMWVLWCILFVFAVLIKVNEKEKTTINQSGKSRFQQRMEEYQRQKLNR